MTNDVVNKGQSNGSIGAINTGACDSCPGSNDGGRIKFGQKHEVLSYCRAVGDYVEVSNTIKTHEQCPHYPISGVFLYKKKTD